jgi:dTDP-glucose pyrophosphorylase
MKPSLVILAAGMGSRYGGLKQIDGVGPHNETIIDYSIYDALRAGFGKIVFVIRKDIEAAFRDRFERIKPQGAEFAYVFQELDSFTEGLETADRTKPWGTAHAVLAASTAVQEPFAVINADDYYGQEAFGIMAEWLKSRCHPRRYAMMGYKLANTLSEYGSVSRGVCALDANGFLARVDERTQVQWQGQEIIYLEDGRPHPVDAHSSVSMNFWGFDPSVFTVIRERFIRFVKETMEQPKAEFFIPLFVQEMIDRGDIQVSVLPCHDRWYGVTYKEDKPMVQAAFMAMCEAGDYPSPLWS